MCVVNDVEVCVLDRLDPKKECDCIVNETDAKKGKEMDWDGDFVHNNWLEDIRKGSCSLKSFLGVAGEGIDEKESSKFEEGLNSKVKPSLYRTFGKVVEFKKYLRGVGDAGTRILFKFRLGMHGLNEELGRHRGREGRKECLLCDAECEC